jgi:hypothetical protein
LGRAGASRSSIEPRIASFLVESNFVVEGKVLGTFCIYSRETRAPEAQDLGLMEKATYLARVAIERDRAEAALRTSQQKYRDLINASPDAVCVIDADSRLCW